MKVAPVRSIKGFAAAAVGAGLVVSSLLILPAAALAQAPGAVPATAAAPTNTLALPHVDKDPTKSDLPALPTLFHNLEGSFGKVWDMVVIAATIVFMVLFLIGGIQYLTAAGNEESTKKARALLVDAVIGLVLVLLAWPIGRYAIQKLQLKSITIDGQPVASTDPDRTVGSTGQGDSTKTANVRLSVLVKNAKPGTAVRLETFNRSSASLGNRQLVSINPQQLVSIQGSPASIRTATTDATGHVSFPGVRTNTFIRLFLEASNKMLFEGTVPPPLAENDTYVLSTDADQGVDELVKIKVVVLHHTSHTGIPNFRIAFEKVADDSRQGIGADTQGNLANYYALANEKGEAFFNLEPGASYQLTPLNDLDTSISTYQLAQPFVVPSDAPLGTEHEAKVWTIFAKPQGDPIDTTPDSQDIEASPPQG